MPPVSQNIHWPVKYGKIQDKQSKWLTVNTRYNKFSYEMNR